MHQRLAPGFGAVSFTPVNLEDHLGDIIRKARTMTNVSAAAASRAGRRNGERRARNFGKSARGLVDLEHGDVIARGIQKEKEFALPIDGGEAAFEAVAEGRAGDGAEGAGLARFESGNQ